MKGKTWIAVLGAAALLLGAVWLASRYVVEIGIEKD